jgi:hypothetical protein
MVRALLRKIARLRQFHRTVQAQPFKPLSPKTIKA